MKKNGVTLSVFEEQLERNENKIFWSDKPEDFIVIKDEPRQNPHRQIDAMVKRLTANYKIEIPEFEGRLVDVKGEQVEPYYTGKLKPGHKIAISGDDIIAYEAIRTYNSVIGISTGNIVNYRYRIIDLGVHSQEVSDFIIGKYNNRQQGTHLSGSLAFFSKVGNTTLPMTKKYIDFEKKVLDFVSKAYKDTKYYDSDVRTVLSAGGAWSEYKQRMFRNGNMPVMNDIDIDTNLKTYCDLYTQLSDRAVAGTLIDYRRVFCYNAARLIRKHQAIKKKIDVNTFVKNLAANPTGAKEDSINPITKQAIFGYYKRMDHGDVERVYKEVNP